jgi:hypothetical protein
MAQDIEGGQVLAVIPVSCMFRRMSPAAPHLKSNLTLWTGAVPVEFSSSSYNYGFVSSLGRDEARPYQTIW